MANEFAPKWIQCLCNQHQHIWDFFSLILKIGNYFAILTTYKFLQCFKEIFMEYGSLEYPYSSLSNKVYGKILLSIFKKAKN